MVFIRGRGRKGRAATAVTVSSLSLSFLIAAASASLPAPERLRINLHAARADGAAVFVGIGAAAEDAALLLSWALPPQPPSAPAPAPPALARAVIADARANGTVRFDSGWVVTPARLQQLLAPAAALPEAAVLQLTVAVADADTNAGPWSAPLLFFTSARPGGATWAASAPVWAQPCGGGGGGGAPSPPAFALVRSDVALPSSPPVASALVFATASPPIYSDPWNVTKILGGYKLRVGGALVGIGPGHADCGPALLPTCNATQPVSGYDVSALAAAAQAAGAPLAIDVTAYALPQPEYGIAPGLQLALRVTFTNGGEDLVIGTTAGAGSAWSALDASAYVNPSGNKDSGWYVQPREDVVTACLPPVGSAAPPAGCAASCGWARPAPAPDAFGGGALPLVGKSTQPVEVVEGLAPAAPLTQLGPGWFVLDAGTEMQGGLSLEVPVLGGSGLVATVQLADELQANGSALWQTRAGMRYQDRWSFPAAPADAAQLRYAHHEFSMFRYAELIFTDAATSAPVDIALNSGGAQAANASFWRVRYPYDEAGAARVTTASADLDAVFELCRRTLAFTSIDIYSDSNSRQRSFDCMADDTTAALSQYATTPELALPRYTMRQILNNKLSQPITATMLPAAGPGLVPPADGFVWVRSNPRASFRDKMAACAQRPACALLTQHSIYFTTPPQVDWTTLPGLNVVYDALYTGDLRFGDKYFDELAQNFTWARAIDSTGLAAGVGALIDTSGGSTDGFTDSNYNSIGNSWVYLGLRSFAQLGRWLGRNATAAQLDATADALQTAFVARMFNGSAVCDGVCAQTPHTAAHSSFYAAMSGIMDGDAAALAGITAFLLDGIARGGDLGMPGGSYSAQFLLQGLYRNGADHGNAAFSVLTSRARHSWLHMMEALGATATTECWLPEELPNLSFSHVWSSSPGSVVPQYLFGLLPTSPGFATLDIRPQPGPLLRGAATLPTVRGPVSISFTQTVPGAPGGCMTVDVGLPGNVAARVLLPRWGANVTVRVDGAVYSSVGIEGDYAFAAVGEGAHSVTTCG